MTTRRARKRSWRALASATVSALTGLALLGAAPSSQATETYTHDERGNVSGITRDGQAATYQYDALDRLKAETGPSTQSITYDANGNRTRDGTSAYSVAGSSNRLTARRNATVVYDAAGNVRLERVFFNGAGVNRTLSYNAANQLSEVRIAGTVSSYLYDHRGLRGRKTLSNPPAGVPAITLYTHDPNGHLFQEIAGSGPNIGQALVTYLWQDDVPAAIVLGPNTPGNPSGQDKLLYLEVDPLNTPRIARDEQKRVVWRWDSDAFGNTAPNEDPDGDGIKTTINLRFPGQYFDAESGLHYNWHRYYDPQVGRYTQPDPIGAAGGVNPYAYVGGNPISYSDPLGLFACGGGMRAVGTGQPGVWKCVPDSSVPDQGCVTGECAAGLPPAPSENRTGSEIGQGQCELICGVLAPGDVIPGGFAIKKLASWAGVNAASSFGCKLYCKEKNKCDSK